MPAGAVTINMPDTDDVSRRIQMWSDDGTDTGKLYNVVWDPASIAAGTPAPVDATAAVKVKGADAHDAVPANDPFGIAALAATTLPTAVAAGDLSRALGDIYGRIIAMPALREQIGYQYTQITNGSETTIVTAASGIKNDLVGLIISNTHASTDVNLTLKDGTGGTTVALIPSVHAQPPAGFTIGFPIPQTAANTNWTITASGSATINVTAIFIKNK